MKLTKTGYRVSKNGVPQKGFEEDAILKTTYEGISIKVEGTYFIYTRKQGDIFVYTQ